MQVGELGGEWDGDRYDVLVDMKDDHSRKMLWFYVLQGGDLFILFPVCVCVSSAGFTDCKC